MNESLPSRYRIGQRWRHPARLSEFESTAYVSDVDEDDSVELVIELTPTAQALFDVPGVFLSYPATNLDEMGLELLAESVEAPAWLTEDTPGSWPYFYPDAATFEEALRASLHELNSLEWAVSSGKIEKVRRILAANPLVARDQGNLLLCAIENGQRAIVELLLDHGAAVSEPWGGKTPLHCAVAIRQRDIIELLLERGAEVNARDADGRTPANLAAWAWDLGEARATVQLLEDRGATLDLATLLCLGRFREARSWLEGNALDRSADELLYDLMVGLEKATAAPLDEDRAYQQAVQALGGQAGSEMDSISDDPPARDESGWWEDAAAVLGRLLDLGADPNAEFPLQRAVRLKDCCIARLLLERGADPNQGVAEDNYLEPRGEAMRSLLRRFGAKGYDDPEVIIAERCAVRPSDHQTSDLFMMNIEGRASLMYSTAREKAQHRYARAWLALGQYERALRFLEKVVERNAGDILAQALLAWILATCPDERLRDGARARRIAAEVEQSLLVGRIIWENDGSGEDWHMEGPTEALAAALAEQKKFRRALSVLNGIDLARVRPDDRARIERMRACFQADEPFRDGPVSPERAALGRQLNELETVGDEALIVSEDDEAGEEEGEFVLGETGCLEVNQKDFGVEGVRRLLDAPCLAEVVTLSIENSSLAVDDVLLLAEGLAAPKLTCLRLSNNRIRDKAGAVLLAVQRWPQLAELDLPNNRLGRRSAAALAANPALANLTRLNLQQNRIRAAGAAALAEAAHLHNLAELNLDYNVIRDEGLCRLAASSSLTGLKKLELSNNRLTARGLAALAASRLIDGLEMLHLSYNRLDDAAASALAQAPCGALTELWLTDNRIGPAGVAALAQAPLLDTVRYLTLSDNPIQLGGIQALARSPYLGQLQRLDITKCPIDEATAHLLAASEHLKALEELHVSEAAVTPKARAILRKRFGKKLVEEGI